MGIISKMAKGLALEFQGLLDLARLAVIKTCSSLGHENPGLLPQVLCLAIKPLSYQLFPYTIMYPTPVSSPRLSLCWDALSSVGIDPSGPAHCLTVSWPPVLVSFSLTSLVFTHLIIHFIFPCPLHSPGTFPCI